MAQIHISKDPPDQRSNTLAYEHLWVTKVKNLFTFKLLYYENNLKFGIEVWKEDLGQDRHPGSSLYRDQEETPGFCGVTRITVIDLENLA